MNNNFMSPNGPKAPTPLSPVHQAQKHPFGSGICTNNGKIPATITLQMQPKSLSKRENSYTLEGNFGDR